MSSSHHKESPTHSVANTKRPHPSSSITQSPSNLLSPEASASKYKARTFSPAPGYLKMRIIELRDMQATFKLDRFNPAKKLEAQVYLNLLEDVNLHDWSTDVTGGMDHAISVQQEQQLNGANFSANHHFLLRPQCATRCYDMRAGNGMWGDEFCLYRYTFPLRSARCLCSARCLACARSCKSQTNCSCIHTSSLGSKKFVRE